MKIIIKNPLDMHVHLRDYEMMEKITSYTSKNFSWALIMPNLIPPIKTLEDLLLYKKRIEKITKKDNFIPYMTVFFNEDLDYEKLKALKPYITSIKLYPDGVTTNSKWGVNDILSKKTLEIFSFMQKLKIPLSIHWETNGFVMDREVEFISIYKKLAKTFPDLKIIMEHITTLEATKLLNKYDNLYATITLHHLLITLDNLAWWMLEPHLFCKPIAKREEDKDALLKLALSWHHKVMFGSDSAPHPIDKKECSHCSAGIFTSPISLQLLTELFEKHNSLDNLQKFISDNAVNIYNLSPIEKEIILEKKEFIIPKKYFTVVPFYTWKKITWSIK